MLACPMNEPLRVLIAGGGIASLELILALRDQAGDRVDIELLSENRELTYHPLAVAEPFGLGTAHAFDLERIAADTGTRLREGTLTAVVPDAHVAVTGDGDELRYDALVVATGARRRDAVAGALTLRSRATFADFKTLLHGLGTESEERLVFAVPGGVTWALPLYEMALMTATWLTGQARKPVAITIATPEDGPLAVFGREVSDRVADLLAERGIELITGVYPTAFADDHLSVRPGDPIPADHAVALPRLAGPALDGLPCDEDGFLPTDPYGRVDRLDGVYAAGDVTAFPVKQGGIATQQADTIAGTIAAAAGADVRAEPFDPVLRGLLLTGQEPSYLRAELAGGRGERASEYEVESPWWPPAKIVGQHLSHYMARLAADQPPVPDAPFLRVETDDVEPYLKNAGS